jgi:hypothetical protein
MKLVATSAFTLQIGAAQRSEPREAKEIEQRQETHVKERLLQSLGNWPPAVQVSVSKDSDAEPLATPNMFGYGLVSRKKSPRFGLSCTHTGPPPPKKKRSLECVRWRE